MPTISTRRIQELVDQASRRTDLAPTLAAAGHSIQLALDLANEAVNQMIRGGPDGQRNPWKWNAINVVPNPLGVLSAIGPFCTFLTNCFQQDYAVPGVINVDWIDECPYFNFSQGTAQNRQVLWADPKRDLSPEYLPGNSRPWKICFKYNYNLQYGIWGQSAAFQLAGMNNPGPGVVYTNPLTAGTTINNPVTQIRDTNGNFWVLTTYGTCGNTTPAFPTNPTYPTLTNPNTAPSTVNDGTCVWTAVNPNGFGFRLSCPPSGNSVTWAFLVVAQQIPPLYTSLGQTLGQIPDDCYHWVRAGFNAKCEEYSPNEKVRARAMGPEGTTAKWLKSLRNAVQATNREQADTNLVPETGFGGAIVPPNPSWPFPGAGG